MGTQAKVTLTAMNSQISPTERVIILCPDYPSIPIGRASKSPTKGLQGASHNAWFDSPVMSRDHAEICFDSKSESLKIKDIGSMHGTRVNNILLTTSVPTALNDGDIIVFGTEVKRGPETFPACNFRVSCEFSKYKTTNTFVFPEDISDLDEDEGPNSSDNNLSQDLPEQISSEDGISIEPPSTPPSLKWTKITNAIDLTRDDSPPELAELSKPTDETSTEKETTYVAESLGSGSEIISHSVCYPNIDIGSGDECDFSDYDSHSGAGPWGLVGMHTEDSEDQESADDASREPSVNSNSSVGSVGSNTNHVDHILDTKGRVDASEDDSDLHGELDQSGGPNDECIRSLFTNGPLSTDTDIPFDFSSYPEKIPDSRDHTHSKQSSPEPDNKPIINIYSDIHEVIVSRSCVPAQENLNSLPHTVGHRQPSPSDAAMIKSAIPKQSSSLNQGVPLMGEGSNSIQHLGQGTGNSTFFRAREANKMIFRSMENSSGGISFTGSSDSFEASHFSPIHPASLESCDATGLTLEKHGVTSRASEYLPRDQCAFLDVPDQTSCAKHESIQLLPTLTCALDYDNSKASIATSSVKKSRSGIKIDDIIEVPLPLPSNGVKRKANDISEDYSEGLRIQDHGSTITGPRELQVTRSLQIQSDLSSHSTDANISTGYDSRPTKRQKFLENLAYVALGGVTAIVGLFSILVATAPEFQ